MAARSVRLYLDEDVSLVVAAMLRARGFNVISTRDAGNLGASDHEQLAYAVTNACAIVSHNRVDFERLSVEYFQNGNDHFGIILLMRRSPHQIVRRLSPFLANTSQEKWKNRITYV